MDRAPPTPTRSVLVLGGIALALVVAAIVAARIWRHDDTPLLRWCMLAGAPIAFGALYAVSRERAVAAARSWAGPFYGWRLRPSGEALERYVVLLPWLATGAVCGAALYALTLGGCRAVASAPVKATCSELAGRDPVRYRCVAPDGRRFQVSLSADEAGGRASLALDARPSWIGVWYIDAASAAPVAPSRDPRRLDDPGMLPLEPGRAEPLPGEVRDPPQRPAGPPRTIVPGGTAVPVEAE